MEIATAIDTSNINLDDIDCIELSDGSVWDCSPITTSTITVGAVTLSPNGGAYRFIDASNEKRWDQCPVAVKDMLPYTDEGSKCRRYVGRTLKFTYERVGESKYIRSVELVG